MIEFTCLLGYNFWYQKNVQHTKNDTLVFTVFDKNVLFMTHIYDYLILKSKSSTSEAFEGGWAGEERWVIHTIPMKFTLAMPFIVLQVLFYWMAYVT